MVFLSKHEIDEASVADISQDDEIASKHEDYAAALVVLVLSDADSMENVHEIFDESEDFLDGRDDGRGTAGDVTNKGDES